MDVYGFILIIYLSSYVSEFATNIDEEETLCVHMKSCVLPCRFTPGSDPDIEWIKRDGGDLTVLSFYHGQNQVLVQHLDYRNRTSLFEEELNTGNASLQLRDVTFKDEGRFLCLANDQVTNVNMKVFAPVSEVHVYSRDGNLYCQAHDIYPKPSLKWTMDPEPSAEPQTSVDRSETGLFSVNSSVPLSYFSYKYTCTVSTEHSTNSATYEGTERPFVNSPEFWVIICFAAVLAVVLAVLAVLAAVWWCIKRNGKTDPPEVQIELEEFPRQSEDSVLNTDRRESQGSFSVNQSTNTPYESVWSDTSGLGQSGPDSSSNYSKVPQEPTETS